MLMMSPTFSGVAIPSFKIGGSVRFDPAAFAEWLRAARRSVRNRLFAVCHVGVTKF